MKQNIINEAVPLFIQYGFKSITIDDIAIKMGVSKKKIYDHFEMGVYLTALDSGEINIGNSVIL